MKSTLLNLHNYNTEEDGVDLKNVNLANGFRTVFEALLKFYNKQNILIIEQ